MHLSDINLENEKLFFRCLWHDSAELQPVAIARQQWYEQFKSVGYKAKLLILDDGTVCGKAHYIPIEYSPLIGKDLMVILCIYVHMYDHHPGDLRGNGYGRFMLLEIEKEARETGAKGIATWAMDWTWNPMTFYEHMRYTETDRKGKAVVLWKPFHKDAIPPRFIRMHDPGVRKKNKVNIVVCDNAWCDGFEKSRIVREAIKGIEDIVSYHEINSPCQMRMLHLGRIGGIFLDGVPYKPYQLPGNPSDLHRKIKKIYDQKIKLQHLK